MSSWIKVTENMFQKWSKTAEAYQSITVLFVLFCLYVFLLFL